MDKPKIVQSFSELIETIRQIFDNDEVDVDLVKDLLASYKSKPIEWTEYAFFDPHRYTRNLVDTGNGKYNLMLICWSQGHGSSIHDHANAHCFMKMLSGSLHEVRFKWPESEEISIENVEAMKVLSEKELIKDDVAYINDSIGLHRVENRSHTIPAVSLHLYTPPFERCHVFDQKTGHRIEVESTFYSMFGKRTPYKISHSKNKSGKEVLSYS